MINTTKKADNNNNNNNIMAPSQKIRVAAFTSMLVMALFMIGKLQKTMFSGFVVSRRRLSSDEEQRRPIMYTFYSPLVRATETPREIKTRIADQELLEAWKTTWYEAGWEPRVLTVQEAQQHPMYVSYKERLDDRVVLIGKGGRNEEYNEYCFLRFLAMAFVGGGTMADYDAFPLQRAHDSPTRTPDRFTVYQKTINKAGPIPALCSGTSTEWERIAHAILDIAEQEPSKDGWSDMMALMRLYRTIPDALILKDDVFGSNEFEKSPTIKEKCILATKKNAWAVHFSHYDVHQSGHRVFDRPQVARDFIAEWNKVCL